jgi:hypothetical protein
MAVYLAFSAATQRWGHRARTRRLIELQFPPKMYCTLNATLLKAAVAFIARA